VRVSHKSRPPGAALLPVPRAEPGTTSGDDIWIVAEPGRGIAIGSEVELTADSVLAGDSQALVKIKGTWIRCQLVKADAAPAVSRQLLTTCQRDLREPGAAPGDGGAGPRVSRENFKAALEPPGEEPHWGTGDGTLTEEIRTLEVKYDDHQERHRHWRDVANSVIEDSFADWPLSGPRTMLWLCKFWARQNKTPTTWLDHHLATESYGATDRSVHELRALAEIFEVAGSYDQLNLGALASFELAARRWQLIISAHSKNAASPDYDGAEYFEGLEKRRFGVAPVLVEHVVKRMKDDAEIEKQRGKARELRAAPKGATAPGPKK